MIYILAVFLPFLAVMLVGRPITGIVLLVLQLTLVGWLLATPLAWIIVADRRADRRAERTRRVEMRLSD